MAVSGPVSGGEGFPGEQKIQDSGALVYGASDAASGGEFVGGAAGAGDAERLLLDRAQVGGGAFVPGQKFMTTAMVETERAMPKLAADRLQRVLGGMFGD